MNGAVELPLDLGELRITASGGSLVRRSVLPSGVRILTEHMPGAQSATVGFWVAVGSRGGREWHFRSEQLAEAPRLEQLAPRAALDDAELGEDRPRRGLARSFGLLPLGCEPGA